MARTSKFIAIHEQSRAYNRIKAKDILNFLYTDFIPYRDLEGFQTSLRGPSGKIINLEEDPATTIGTAVLRDNGKRVAIIAQNTPSNPEERTKLNYGLVKADGYGLSLNMLDYAEKNGLIVHTYIDTVGGDPFEYSSGKLQSWLISYCQSKMISLSTKSISIIIGSGGSGGAIAIQLAHRRLMLSRAEYSVITAEGCSAILFRNSDNVPEALEVLQPSADYMLKYGIIDKIINEPPLDKANYKEKILQNIKKSLTKAIEELEITDVKYLQKNLIDKINQCGQITSNSEGYKAFAKKIKGWLSSYSFSRNTTPEVSHMQIALYGAEPYFCNDEKDPDGKIIRNGCKKHFTREELHDNYNSCPFCHKPNSIGSDDYLHLLLDTDSFHEIMPDLSTENIDPKFSFMDYSETRKKMAKRTDSKESLVIGYGNIFNIPVAVAVSDFRYMGGSMGSAFGEKMKFIVDFAIEQKKPLISICVSGGARMQEGTISLYQMAKTINAFLKMKSQNLPIFSILGHPTTGGALASYAVQGDVIIAEKKATIAFAGDRVVKLTSGGRGVDPEVMTSEFYAEEGGIHIVTERKQLKSLVSGMLKLTAWYKNMVN